MIKGAVDYCKKAAFNQSSAFFVFSSPMKRLLYALMTLYSFAVSAQTPMIDSLKNLLANAKEDSNKVFTLTDIADELTDIDFRQSLSYSEQGMKLAEKINFRKGIAQAYATTANAYSQQSDYVHCLENNLKALEIRQQLGNEREIAASYDNIGNVYNDQGNFTKAIEYYEKSRIIDEKNNDQKSLAILYNNFGSAYANRGDLKKSVEFLFKALTLKDKLGNKKSAANTANNIAVVYKMQGNYTEALNFNLKALKYREELKDSMGLGFSYTNIGLVYRNLKEEHKAEENFLQALKIFRNLNYEKGIAAATSDLGIIYKNRKEYDKALLFYTESLKLVEKQNDKGGIAIALGNIASVYGKKNKYAEAESNFILAEKAAKEAQSFEVLKDTYEMYSIFYEDKGDYKNALKYHLLFTRAIDSLRGHENASALADMKTRYETDLKEKENDTLRSENQVKDLTISQKNTQRNIFIILFISVIIIGSLLYSRVRMKRKEELAKEMMIQQELRSKAVIDAEERERTRIARELHDGIGQQLSAAKLNVAGLQAVLKNKSGEENTLLQNAVELLDDSVKEVRSVSHSMMPNALVKSGLVSAMREFIHRISAGGNLKINLEIIGLTERLEQTTETVLFRALQEIVTNIIKHAEANEVSIQLIQHENELNVLIEDNGVGFDVQKTLRDANGIGLKNIQSRIEFLKGNVFFDSYPGKGTTITIELPV